MFLLGVMFTLSLLLSIAPSIASTSTSSSDGFISQIPLSNSDIRDRPSPQNFFNTSQIKVYKDKVILEVEDVVWAGFEDTKSMLPVINKDSNALQVVPNCPDDIHLGDIVSYKSHYASGIIIHRVVHIDFDSEGVYFVLKGDNNPSSDPGKIRCSQIQRKVIAIIY